MKNKDFVIGIDFGTDSVRSLIVDAYNGKVISSALHYYKRWQAGKFCDPSKNQFRQHPLDYIDGLEISVKEAITKAGKNIKSKIRGISVDTTGSTPCAVDHNCIPLALKKGFENNPNAMFVLWKDHTAVREALEINDKAKIWKDTDFTKYSGGVYSSEWFWAKILHILKTDVNIGKNAYSWIEHCDWIPALLTGVSDTAKVKRSRCAAGHKAMWHNDFNGLPDEKFLISINPLFKGIRNRLYNETYTNDKKAGNLSAYWAKKLGLSEDVIVGVGAFDAHMGAVGGQIVPYVLCKIIGTSTCDVLIAPVKDIGKKLIKGICGQVDGSVLPEMTGMEAGQSAYGDIYAWFKNILLWPMSHILEKKGSNASDIKFYEKVKKELLNDLTKTASELKPGSTDILSADWMNGRRTPYANQLLKGALTGLNLGTDAPKIFRSLVEATAFGSKKIVERFLEEGVKIKSVIAMGGIPKKSPFIMQVLSDVLNMNIKIVRSEQACALGAAMCAAAASGIYPTLAKAQKAMSSGFEKEYRPDKKNAQIYQKLYKKYEALTAFIEKSGI